MKRFLAALAMAGGTTLPAQPPAARVQVVTDVLHGVPVKDPYRWLEDGASLETKAWVTGQMKYLRSILDARPERAGFQKRLNELLRTDSVAAPRERNGRYFYIKRPANSNRQAIYFRASATSDERVIVDPASISPDENVSVHLLEVNREGQLVAYGVRQGGQDEQTVHFLEVESGRVLPASMPAASYISIMLSPDGRTVYASTIDAKGPSVWRFSTTDGKRKKVFGEGYGPEKIVVLQMSPDGSMVVVNVAEGSAGDRGEVWFLDPATDAVTPLVRGLEAKVFGSPAGGQIYLFTNWNAPRNRMFRVDPKRPQRHFWKLIVPEGPDSLEGANFLAGGLILNYSHNATTRLVQVNGDGGFIRELQTPGLGTAHIDEDRWEQRGVFVTYTSFTTPETIYRVEDGQWTVWAKKNVPLDPSQFEVTQVWFRSKDGTRVPMFVVAKRGLEKNGNSPALLTGYGGFTVTLTPYFSAEWIPWLEHGGVYAVANMRGGGEFGEQWHRAGMLDKKQNVFDDFYAAADWLIEHGYTSRKKLAIAGGSNGGLLVGAALTQRPELFGAVVCEVPLLDMLRYQKFSIARLWVPEYGSAENPEQFTYLTKYSPYHNVRSGVKYPPVMFVTGDSDTRVDPLHARKMAALMQAQGADALLHYDTASGHSGGAPVTKRVEDGADLLTFLWWKVGGAAVTSAMR